MKSVSLFFLLLLFVSQPLRPQEDVSHDKIAGSWIGRIQAGGISLRVVFDFTVADKDSIAVTFASPDQGSKNISIGPVILWGKEINVKAPLLLAEYKGSFKNDTLIEGTWYQAGRSAPLNISKLRQAFSLNRPQEPTPPFPYISEGVTFMNEIAGIELAGTLTYPRGDGPFPAVILVSGSGSQNRNEELMGHKPFLVIADHLTRNGIAVLRYDDRGVGQSKGSPLNSTTADFATDAEAAFLYLRKRKEIDSGYIGIAGHSEGGLIAPMVASRNPETAFIISLAGTGVKGETIMHTQNYEIGLASGMDPTALKRGVAINKKLFAVLKKENDDARAAEKIRTVYKKILEKEKKSTEEVNKLVSELNNSLNPASYPWIRYFITTDPGKFWKKVKCPVLALNGDKDLQVSAAVNLPAIEKALRAGGNNNVTVKMLPGLNHLFQNCKTGLPAEYGEIEETFSQEVMEIMADWIKALK
ncbi:MAG: alpha/beta hydrolase [Bacteroidales bacterium]|nr:alpha/beta hydrolase [Bacteroidales bacterium]MBN2634229.1 alpha/beta hydrolase [Bacteroidales bacterium]